MMFKERMERIRLERRSQKQAQLDERRAEVRDARERRSRERREEREQDASAAALGGLYLTSAAERIEHERLLRLEQQVK